MTEDFVTYELAKKLAFKGFNDPCIAYYDEGFLRYNTKYPFALTAEELMISHNSGYTWVDAPTITQVLNWLREGKKMYIEPCILVDYDTDADNNVINTYTYWSFSITSIESGDMIYYEYEHIDDKRFDSYEQSAIAGIEYVLDNLI